VTPVVRPHNLSVVPHDDAAVVPVEAPGADSSRFTTLKIRVDQLDRDGLLALVRQQEETIIQLTKANRSMLMKEHKLQWYNRRQDRDKIIPHGDYHSELGEPAKTALAVVYRGKTDTYLTVQSGMALAIRRNVGNIAAKDLGQPV